MNGKSLILDRRVLGVAVKTVTGAVKTVTISIH